MNHNEIEERVRRAKSGDREELLSLLEQYKPYVLKSIRQMNTMHYDNSDLLQTGYMAIINAVKKYKLGSNTFTAYVVHAIKNSFRYAYRKTTRLDSELRLNAPLNDSEDSTEFIDCLSDDSNIEEEVINSICLLELKKTLSKLPTDETELLTAVYYNNCSVLSYTKNKGLNYLQTIRKKNQILEKLRGPM